MLLSFAGFSFLYASAMTMGTIAIQAEGWEQMWSGFLGSLIAAIVGGVVALLVVKLTNRQHRRESSRGRQIAAISDMVLALDEMVRIVSEPDDHQDIRPSVSRLQGAAARWQMELPKGALRTELRRSTLFLHRFAEEIAEPASFAEAVGIFRFQIMSWPSSSHDEREHIAQVLVEMRANFEKRWREEAAKSSANDANTHAG